MSNIVAITGIPVVAPNYGILISGNLQLYNGSKLISPSKPLPRTYEVKRKHPEGVWVLYSQLDSGTWFCDQEIFPTWGMVFELFSMYGCQIVTGKQLVFQ